MGPPYFHVLWQRKLPQVLGAKKNYVFYVLRKMPKSCSEEGTHEFEGSSPKLDENKAQSFFSWTSVNIEAYVELPFLKKTLFFRAIFVSQQN